MDALLPLKAKIALFVTELLYFHCLFKVNLTVPTILTMIYPPFKIIKLIIHQIMVIYNVFSYAFYTLIVLMSFPLHKAIGTSTLIMVITALSSTVGYAARGNIDLVFCGFLAVGAVLGGILGSRYANKINEKILLKIVGICFMGMGVVMTAIEIFK
jgi:hypothetical protein